MIVKNIKIHDYVNDNYDVINDNDNHDDYGNVIYV